MVNAVGFCHQNGVTHRDIKPENVLINRDENGKVVDVKLADFGRAVRATTRAQLQKNDTRFGTHGYLPPEFYDESFDDLKKVDSWALGVLLFNLITGTMPFTGNEKALQKKVTDKKKQPKYNSKAWKQCSPEVLKLTKTLLDKNADSRLDVSDIISSPWLSEVPSKSGGKKVFLKRKVF